MIALCTWRFSLRTVNWKHRSTLGRTGYAGQRESKNPNLYNSHERSVGDTLCVFGGHTYEAGAASVPESHPMPQCRSSQLVSGIKSLIPVCAMIVQTCLGMLHPGVLLSAPGIPCQLPPSASLGWCRSLRYNCYVDTCFLPHLPPLGH